MRAVGELASGGPPVHRCVRPPDDNRNAAPAYFQHAAIIGVETTLGDDATAALGDFDHSRGHFDERATPVLQQANLICDGFASFPATIRVRAEIDCEVVFPTHKRNVSSGRLVAGKGSA